jgi:hypothetical protein
MNMKNSPSPEVEGAARRWKVEGAARVAQSRGNQAQSLGHNQAQSGTITREPEFDILVRIDSFLNSQIGQVDSRSHLPRPSMLYALHALCHAT